MATDQDLAALLIAGDADALAELICRWRSRAEAFAYSILHDAQAAEDAVLEAFSRIYALRSGLDAKRSFSAYLFTIVKRVCIDELRKQKRAPELPGELPELPVASAEAEYIRHWERLNRLHLLASLDETERRLLLAFALEGKPTKQIAAEMQLPDVQVRVRLHRIRRKLKKGVSLDA